MQQRQSTTDAGKVRMGARARAYRSAPPMPARSAWAARARACRSAPPTRQGPHGRQSRACRSHRRRRQSPHGWPEPEPSGPHRRCGKVRMGGQSRAFRSAPPTPASPHGGQSPSLRSAPPMPAKSAWVARAEPSGPHRRCRQGPHGRPEPEPAGPHRRCGKVRMGGQSPSLPVRTADAGKVRMGGQSPSLPVRRPPMPQSPHGRPEPEPPGSPDRRCRQGPHGWPEPEPSAQVIHRARSHDQARVAL